jgi:GT2 family glycosyltransferase
MTRIAVAIVNHNTRDHLRRCLASIQSAQPETAAPTLYPIVVIDNASTDGSADMVRAEFPAVELLATGENPGYGAAANTAIAHCRADYALLLNSDTLVESGVVDALADYLDCHPQVAIAGPRLHNADGSLQPSCYPEPTPLNLFLEESLVGRLAASVPGLRDRYLRTWRHDEPRPVPWVLGAALAIRRAAFEAVGGFDPAFTMYFEETDLCHRLWTAGWQIHFAPVGVVVHVGGASTRSYYAKMQRRLFTSMQLFYARHYPPGQTRLLHLALLPVVTARLAADAVRYVRAHNTPQRELSSELLRVRFDLLRRCLSACVATPQRP